jgi:hypothetical protein
MLRKPLLSFLLALILGAVFFAGLGRLFVLRYEVGDVYPLYSSLRADPLGTKALAEALGELPGLEIQRNFKPLPKLRPNGPVTLFYAGVPRQSYWSGRELLTFDTLILNGSRAVFTFFPVETPPSKSDEQRLGDQERKKKEEKSAASRSREKKSPAGSPTPEPSENKSDKKKKDEAAGQDAQKTADEETPISFDAVAKRWGFNFGYLPGEKGKSYVRSATLLGNAQPLEPEIPWHSVLAFKDLKSPWKVLYMCGKMPVVIERQYGRGSIILVADSFLVSNEALRGERHPQLLSWLFSGPPTIVFDEEHNDVRENPGIASLVRKYRLHGVVAGLLLLALLFVWKNAVRFVPAYTLAEADRDVVTGKDSSEGFINLLRRTIAPSALLDACLAEWRKAFSQRRGDLARVEEIWAHEQSRPTKYRDPISIYRAISAGLARKP